jgi:hypothetical protein
MDPPYNLDGESRLKRVTVTSTAGPIENIYLFQVPHSLIESTKQEELAKRETTLLYEPDAHLDSLISDDETEWKTFVTFGLPLPCEITTEMDPSFKLPETSFRQMKTSRGIDVYQLTDNKL